MNRLGVGEPHAVHLGHPEEPSLAVDYNAARAIKITEHALDQAKEFFESNEVIVDDIDSNLEGHGEMSQSLHHGKHRVPQGRALPHIRPELTADVGKRVWTKVSEHLSEDARIRLLKNVREL